MALVGAVLLAVTVVAFILQPVIQGRYASLRREDDEMTEVEARRRVTLLALRDVEYDFHTGKLDAEDYEAMKRQLSAEALEALKEAERVDAEEAGAPVAQEPAALEALEEEIRRVRKGLEVGVTCGSCGELNPNGSRFCGACGTPLASETAGTR